MNVPFHDWGMLYGGTRIASGTVAAALALSKLPAGREWNDYCARALAEYVASYKTHHAMRILVEPSDYVLRNVGDMAMLRSAVSRLARLWPDATIQVLSDEPEALASFCPQATPLPSAGRYLWLINDFLPGRRRAPKLSQRLQATLRRHAPELIEIFWRRTLQTEDAVRELDAFTEAVRRADLVIVTGMGGITDVFPEYARDLLETLRLAVRRRRYVAMVGQGFGPLTDPDLVARARAVLPRVNFIALREERASKPLLQSLGVSDRQLMTTGDDAVELAYDLRCHHNGACLGVNVRASGYSGVDPAFFEPLSNALKNAARKYGVGLVPIPISFVPGEADAETIWQLIQGREVDLPQRSPEAVIRQIQRCRLVVTGSYHAGVFALASGIPTIGLALSDYYVDKFQGLSALFGEGCQTVMLREPDFALRLEAAIAHLWDAAERVRPSLLAEAARQVQQGHTAYRRIYEEVRARR